MLMASICRFWWNSSGVTRRNNTCFFGFEGKYRKIFNAWKANSLNYLQIYVNIEVEVYTSNQRNLILENLKHTLQAIFMKKVCCQSLCLTVLMRQYPLTLKTCSVLRRAMWGLRDYEISLLLYIVDWEWLNDSQTILHMFSEVERLKIFDLRDQHVSQQAILC